MPGENAIGTLVRFVRLASESGRGAQILPLLADALVEQGGADAVAIAEIQHDGRAMLVPSLHLPKELEGVTIDPDAIGEELGSQLLAATGGRFVQVRSRPLVSGGRLFGSVATFHKQREAVHDAMLEDGLVDLAAIALETATQLHELVRSHTELRASQELLVRNEKLRALGQMAAGVSHDLKNILNPLSLYMQLIERAIDKGQSQDAKEGLGDMKKVLTRGIQTIERLREYSRQSSEPKTERVDLNRLILEAREIARPRMAARGSIVRVVEELGSPPPVNGRASDIISALVNLIVNAIDAMTSGGTIVLRTGERDGGGFVQVEDDGPGMPKDVEKRVFEPFFTTKGEDGTGLGLAMVYACVQRHNGRVTLLTELGKGTTFTLWFPSV